METIDTTNGRIARVLADLDELIAWAVADMEDSHERHDMAQAKDDQQRQRQLREARELVAASER